ncbi:MAG: leucyl aminopeptidase family protein [Planctomycetota bacterium]
MAQAELIPVADPLAALSGGGSFDAVVAVGPAGAFEGCGPVASVLAAAAAVDRSAPGALALYPAPELAGGRLVHAPTGPLDRDQDDVRRFADAAASGLRRARDAGSTRPFLLLGGVPSDALFREARAVSLLGALGGLWEPLEGREAHGEHELEPVRAIGFAAGDDGESLARYVSAVEAGRRLARDLGGTEPERMAPPRMADLMREAFAGTSVKVKVIADRATIDGQYPLAGAVARASWGVERHHPRVVRLEYDPGGDITETILIAGKGLSYDTGGADLKVNGVMAGMSRDKCGGANAAGFLRTVASLQPKGVRVVAEIGCVRNSIGSDCFVADEIITSHAGVRCRIGNTDAEGRLVLAELLSHLREEALKSVNPRILSLATLTGHAGRAVGPYTIALDNRPARGVRVAARLEECGEVWGDCFDLSRLRREDWDFVKPHSRADDTLTCNNAPSSATPRGHQFPMAFLSIASGLAKHGPESERPIAYTHVDIGGSAAEGSNWQHGRPTAAPLVAMAALWARG